MILLNCIMFCRLRATCNSIFYVTGGSLQCNLLSHTIVADLAPMGIVCRLSYVFKVVINCIMGLLSFRDSRQASHRHVTRAASFVYLSVKFDDGVT